MPTPLLSLLELREHLSEEAWSDRLAAAQAEADLLERVLNRARTGVSRRSASSEVFPERPFRTVRRRLVRYVRGGVEALVDRRRPGGETVLTPEIAAMVRGMLAVRPELRSSALAEALVRAGHPIGKSTLRVFLAEEGLSHPVGRPAGVSRVPTPLALAGAHLLLAVEQETRAVAHLTEAMGAALDALPAPEGPVRDDTSNRDDHGRFLPTYNEVGERTDPELGERFDSVETRRVDKDLPQMRVANSSENARYRKDLTLTLLPIVVEGARWSELSHWRGAQLKDLIGIAYQPATLDKHARELKLAGMAETARATVAAHWLEPGHEAVDSATGMVIAYCDLTTKPIWTHQFTKSTKVSSTGRVQPATSTFFLHSGAGTPLLFRSFCGHVSVPREVMSFLNEYEAMAGEGTLQRVVVLDRESHAVWLFKELSDSKWLWVVPLREQVVGKSAVFEDQTPWVPYGDVGDEVCEARLTLRDSKAPKEPFQIRVVGRRRHRTGKISWFGTNAPGELLVPGEVLRIYFDRWPLQEHVFRDGKGHVGLDHQHGYGKKRITDVAIVNKLDQELASKKRLEEALAAAEASIAAASQRCTELEQDLARTVTSLEERSSRLDQAVHNGLHGSDFLPEYQAAQVLRRKVAATTAELGEAEAKLDKIFHAKQAKIAAIARAVEEITRLGSRREIFTVDTDLDEIMCAYKITFMNMAHHLIRRHLQEPMELDTLIKGVLTLPGERIRTPTTETIRIFDQPRDPKTMVAVRKACVSLTALGLKRNKRRLRYEFVESETTP